jgi:hypothetical protein
VRDSSGQEIVVEGTDVDPWVVEEHEAAEASVAESHTIDGSRGVSPGICLQLSKKPAEYKGVGR